MSEHCSLNSNSVPDEFHKKIEDVISKVALDLRELGYTWDSICNFVYKTANDGLFSAEQDELLRRINK